MISAVEPAPVSHESRLVSTELVEGADAFMGLQPEWDALYEASETQNPFLTWEWVSTWVQHWCGGRLRTIVARIDGQAVGIAPMHLNRYLIGPGLYTSALQLFGPKEVHHLFEMREILARPGYEQAAITSVMDRALKIPGWDWIELSAYGSGLTPVSSLLDSWRLNGFRLDPEPLTYVPVMNLERSWEAQRQRLKRNIKESIRHCYNSLKRDGHEHRYLADGGAMDAEAAAARLVQLHHRRSLVAQRRWHRDHFADDAIRAFELDVLRKLHTAGRARFSELCIGDRTIAARACLESHGGLYFYYSGFDPEWWKYSVMTLVVTEAIQDAIARGLSTVNFSPGVDDSKSRWGPELIPMQTFALVRSNPLSEARYRLLRMRKRVRQPLHRQLDRILGVLRARK